MRTYSNDLRERIVAARERGHSAAEIARLLKLSKRSVERYCKLQATTGSIQPRQRGGYRRSRLAKHDQTLRRWIGQQPDLTLAELQTRIARQLKVRLGITALWHRLERLGLSYKKTLHAAEQDPPDVALARQQWQSRQPSWPAARLVFLDETGLNTRMTRRYGRAAKAERCLCRVPHGHWSTATFIVGRAGAGRL